MSIFSYVLSSSLQIALPPDSAAAKRPMVVLSSAAGAKTIFYLSKIGHKHPIDSFETFTALGLVMRQVMKIHAELIDMLPTGRTISALDPPSMAIFNS